MNAIILLRGYLTGGRVREMLREIESYKKLARDGPMSLHLVIDSEGGATEEALVIVKAFKGGGFQSFAKIYQARSATALIAMSANEREIVRGGVFEINLGSAEIDSGTLITEEKVPAPIIAQARKWREAVFGALAQCGFPGNGEHMSRLIAQNRLLLAAEECLDLGIVSRII